MTSLANKRASDRVRIDPTARVADRAVIEPGDGTIAIKAYAVIEEGVVIQADQDAPTVIGEKCRVEKDARITSANLGAYSTVGEGAVVESFVFTGEFSVLAPNTRLPEGAKVPARALCEGDPFTITRGLTAEEMTEARKR